jgi:hypothetical protein
MAPGICSSWDSAGSHSEKLAFTLWVPAKHKNVSGTKPENSVEPDAAPAAKKLPLKTLRGEDCSVPV